MLSPLLLLRLLLAPIWRLCGTAAQGGTGAQGSTAFQSRTISPWAVVPLMIAAALGQVPVEAANENQPHVFQAYAFQALNVATSVRLQDAAPEEQCTPAQQYTPPQQCTPGEQGTTGAQLTGFDPSSQNDAEEDAACAGGEREEDPEAPTVSYVRRTRFTEDTGLACHTLKAFAHASSRPLLDWLHEQRAPRGPPVSS